MAIGPTDSRLEDHYRVVVRELKKGGRVTPVLGAGASLYARPQSEGEAWRGRYPPSSGELAAYLAGKYDYPTAEGAAPQAPDLLRVSQYIFATEGGSGVLYDELHDVFAAEFPTTPLHDFLADVPGALRDKGLLKKSPLILTTNYDDLMERALDAAGEPFDLVVYMAEGENGGKFCHRAPNGELEPIDAPESAIHIDPDKQTVVLKIHGFVDHEDDSRDSFVITEDHYIEYLARIDLENLLPPKVVKRLKNCHFVFLGYSLRDWNLRAMLLQLWDKRRADNDWWAIQSNPDELDLRSWERRGVTIFNHPLDEYIEQLKVRFEADLAS